MKKSFYERPELTQFEQAFNENLHLLNIILDKYQGLNISNINSMDELKNLFSNPRQFVLEVLKKKLPMIPGGLPFSFPDLPFVNGMICIY